MQLKTLTEMWLAQRNQIKRQMCYETERTGANAFFSMIQYNLTETDLVNVIKLKEGTKHLGKNETIYGQNIYFRNPTIRI